MHKRKLHSKLEPKTWNQQLARSLGQTGSCGVCCYGGGVSTVQQACERAKMLILK